MILRLLAGLLSLTSAHAAPIPLTSSSLLTSQKAGIYRSPLGFSVNAGRSGWSVVAEPVPNDYVVATYKSPNSANALTVRVDELEKPLTLEAYSKKWLKDYPRFGFSVLDSKKVKVGNDVAYMLDFVSRENKKQLRQLLFVKNQKAVTLTCRGDQTSFAQTVKSCNEIFRSFKW